MAVSLAKSSTVPVGFTRVRTRVCFICGHDGHVNLPSDGLTAYNRGALLQTAFSTTDAGTREQFQSGIHVECWNSAFGNESEDHR